MVPEELNDYPFRTNVAVLGAFDRKPWVLTARLGRSLPKVLSVVESLCCSNWRNFRFWPCFDGYTGVRSSEWRTQLASLVGGPIYRWHGCNLLGSIP